MYMKRIASRKRIVDMNNLFGVVLCGGESRRMGRDKGLLIKGSTPWAQFVAEKLAPFRLSVAFSVRSAQIPAYAAAIPQGRFIADTLDLAGPLKGLLSIHEKFPDKDLLLLACDMLDLDASTIRTMIDAYVAGGYEFYVYQQGAFAQPFCGIYTSGGLATAYGSVSNEPSPDFSLQSLLNKGKTKRVAIAREEAFANYNFCQPDL